MAKANLTAQRLRELLEYDADTGVFRWKVDRGSFHKGDAAGYREIRGQWLIGIDNHLFDAARLAWLYVHGYMPKRCMIHRDGNRVNCSITNLVNPVIPIDVGLTAERLHDLLDYCPDTGVFTWRAKRGSSATTGSVAGYVSKYSGYVFISVDGHACRAHRLAWLYVHGQWPSDEIDHINGCRADNRISNLRDVAPLLNKQNLRGPRSDNTSGFLGVWWDSSRNLWAARIGFNGRTVHLGRRKTPEEAHELYLTAKRKLHEGCTI